MTALPDFYKLSAEVQRAQRQKQPLVALETALLTHGLPRPQNLETAQTLESIVRAGEAIPASIGVLAGRVLVGMEAEELEELAQDQDAAKLSSRDLGAAIAGQASGGCTVAGTLRVAAQAGISVFATGGIGGVHPGRGWDVSADLMELAWQPLVVVCAGAKSILDLPATLERLESLAVPVIGYQTDAFPAFYARKSGLRCSGSVESAAEVAELAEAHWRLGGKGIVLAVPLPEESALKHEEMEGWITEAQAEAEEQGIGGQALTPYLLKRLSELSEGKSLQANFALLENNARLAAQLAGHLQPRRGPAAGLIPKKA